MANERIIDAPDAPEAAAFGERYINLLQPRLGAEVIYATDDFFAPKERMIDPEPPVFAEERYDDHGKWMDGWESRRRRNGGHDWAIVKLGGPALPRRADVDTTFFTGNYPPSASIEGSFIESGGPDDQTDWFALLDASPLDGNSHNLFELKADRPVTHIRLQIYPDGGVARLRLYGDVGFDWASVGDNEVDLAASAHGGRALYWNDSHYGTPDTLLAPGRGINMGDGWETRRRREPGSDWVILRLGHVGVIERALVDTAHFKGNFPHSCSLQGALVTDGADESLVTRSMFWPDLMAPQPLTADAEHGFADLASLGPVSHVRFNIFPDGGVSRLRLFGKVSG